MSKSLKRLRPVSGRSAKKRLAILRAIVDDIEKGKLEWIGILESKDRATIVVYKPKEAKC